MKVEALKRFKDGSGKWREIGDQWIIWCEGCALGMKKSGLVKIIEKRPK